MQFDGLRGTPWLRMTRPTAVFPLHSGQKWKNLTHIHFPIHRPLMCCNPKLRSFENQLQNVSHSLYCAEWHGMTVWSDSFGWATGLIPQSDVGILPIAFLAFEVCVCVFVLGL